MQGRSAILGVVALSCASLTHAAVELACKLTGNERIESVVLRKDKTWSSAAGGWLGVVKGTWIQKSIEGVILRDGNNTELGLVKGLVYDKATKGVEFVFRFDAGGNTGSCLVNSTEI